MKKTAATKQISTLRYFILKFLLVSFSLLSDVEKG